MFWGFELDVMIVFDGEGNVGLQITPAGRLGVDVAIGVNPAISWSPDANSISEMTGLGLFIGADVGLVSGAFTWSVNTSLEPECREGVRDDRGAFGGQVSGFGPGGGLGITGGAGYTFMPISGRPFK